MCRKVNARHNERMRGRLERVSPRCRAALAAVVLLVLAGCRAPGADVAPPRTRLVLLGTGTPNAEPERSGPSVAVVVDSTAYVVDAGPGVVRRAAAARGRGIEALAARNLKRLFLTHLHSDHTAGYPDLILTPWVLGRNEPLEVYGPPGTRAMTEHIVAAYEEDIRLRIEGPEPANERGWRVNVHEIEPGVIYEDELVRVIAFPVSHGSWRDAFGFRFEGPDRVIVISGDTAPTDEVVEQCEGCDILLHEVYSDAGFRRRSPAWQRYHAAFHTSASELGALAQRARPGILVLYHQLLWGSTPGQLLEEIGRVYDGPVRFGNDLDVFPK